MRDLTTMLTPIGYCTEHLAEHLAEHLPATNRLLSTLSAMVDVDGHHYVLRCRLGAAMDREK